MAQTHHTGRNRLWQLLLQLWIILAVVLSGVPAYADLTGSWTFGTNSASSPVRGITTQFSGNPGGTGYVNNTFATTTFWNDPYGGTVSGAASLAFTIGTTGATIIVTFSEPVDNPVLHVDRMGGNNGGANSSIWTLSSSVSQGGSVTLTRLSGNAAFTLTGSAFRRADIGTTTGGTECVTTGDTAACGSVRFNGTGITSLTFAVTMTANFGAGDGVEMGWSFVGSNVIVRKQSTGGTAIFPFTGTNGVPTTAFNLNTGTSNPISSATFAVTNHAANITITETATTGFQINATSCQDAGGNAVTSSLSGQTLTIAPAAYGGNQTITCTFTNGAVADLSIAKTNTPASGINDQANDAVSPGPTTYTITVTNNGSVPVTGPVVRDTPTAGLTCPGANTVNCSPAAACAGPYTVASLTSAGGITLGTLASSAAATLSFSCTVN